MTIINEEYIKQCSTTLGIYDSDTVNLLVTLFRHQQTNSPCLGQNPSLREKFENLLSCEIDDENVDNDTNLTRVELTIMFNFKRKYLSDSKAIEAFSFEHELDLAYCVLLAQIDDRLASNHLTELKFLLGVRNQVETLFELFQGLGKKFADFFIILHDCGYFRTRLVAEHVLMESFRAFIRRYESFLLEFSKINNVGSDQSTTSIQLDAILNQVDAIHLNSTTTKKDSAKPEKIQVTALSREASEKPNQEEPSATNSSTKKKKGVCVIINIENFSGNDQIEITKRNGSEKDVALVKIVFTKLGFTVLQSRHDFTRKNVEDALSLINNHAEYGHFETLVVFIMSHGLLSSFFTSDSQEIIIRDIVRRFSDSNQGNIWIGKPRLFFIQACRSNWPLNLQSPRKDVELTDLSKEMLIAYSCSPSEASSRSPKTGSIFIQILCIMVLRYGHSLSIQQILEWTSKFVMKRDEYFAEVRKIEPKIQKPEFIQKEFSKEFRFSTKSLYGEHYRWDSESRSYVDIALTIWKELNLLFCQS